MKTFEEKIKQIPKTIRVILVVIMFMQFFLGLLLIIRSYYLPPFGTIFFILLGYYNIILAMLSLKRAYNYYK